MLPKTVVALVMVKTLFLPGASGSASFWKPLAVRAELDGIFFSWPGLGIEPPTAGIDSISDLVTMVAKEVTEPVSIIAQSMGGFVAIKLALAFPDLVKSLVLAVTSGGVPASDLGGIDWRSNYSAHFPQAAKWIADRVPDLSDQIQSIKVPTLLLWGDSDPISPVAVGERLSALLPNARLRIFNGADHDLGQTHSESVAVEVKRHLLAAL